MAAPPVPVGVDSEPPPGDGGRRPEAAIRARVLSSLGRPDRPYRVAVVPLWPGHYRVNVMSGADFATARIAHSFFVVADDRGAVIESTPPIRRADGDCGDPPLPVMPAR